MDRLETAMALAAEGFLVFPLKENEKIPATSNGFYDATREPKQLQEWWLSHPEWNLGIRTGKDSDLDVIDLDMKNGKDGIGSYKSIADQLPTGNRIIKTPNGYHVYVKHSGALHTGADFLEGLDVRSDGGYVVGQSSVVDGKTYELHRDAPMQRIETVPDVLKRNTRARPKVDIPEVLRGVPEGSREQTAFALIDQLYRLGVPQDVARPIVYSFADRSDRWGKRSDE